MAKGQGQTQEQEMDAQEIEQLDACRRALTELGRIATAGERVATLKKEDGTESAPPASGVYRINRCRHQVVITAADIEAARSAATKGTLAECRKALRPFRLPGDPRIEDADAAVYVFPAEGGGDVPVSNAFIDRIAELSA